MIFKHVDLNPEIKIKTLSKEKLKIGGGIGDKEAKIP